MPFEKLSGFLIILLGLGVAFLADKIFNWTAHLNSSRTMIERWPPWMIPTWIWIMRVAGIATVLIGVLLILRNK